MRRSWSQRSAVAASPVDLARAAYSDAAPCRSAPAAWRLRARRQAPAEKSVQARSQPSAPPPAIRPTRAVAAPSAASPWRSKRSRSRPSGSSWTR
ncbi:hypothetical protein VR44_27315, partial [Streptomyces katrae]